MRYIFLEVKSKVGNIHLSSVLQMWVLLCPAPINMPIHQIHTYVLCFVIMVIFTTDIAIIRNQIRYYETTGVIRPSVSSFQNSTVALAYSLSTKNKFIPVLN
jgi:hypothetical protein